MGKHKKLTSLEKSLINLRWKRVVLNGKESDYKISDEGDLISLKTYTMMTPCKDSSGYYGTTLYMDGVRYYVSIHRLVAIAFVDNPDPVNKIQVNHKNGDKCINKWWNLEWVTQQENIEHAVNTGLRDSFKGEGSPKNVYPESIIRTICQMLEDGRTQKYISDILGVNKGTINGIKQGKCWKHISNQYKIPEPISRTPRRPGLREDVIKLINQGYDNNQILDLVDLDDIKVNRTYVAVIRSEIKKTKVTSSSTIDQLRT